VYTDTNGADDRLNSSLLLHCGWFFLVFVSAVNYT